MKVHRPARLRALHAIEWFRLECPCSGRSRASRCRWRRRSSFAPKHLRKFCRALCETAIPEVRTDFSQGSNPREASAGPVRQFRKAIEGEKAPALALRFPLSVEPRKVEARATSNVKRLQSNNRRQQAIHVQADSANSSQILRSRARAVQKREPCQTHPWSQAFAVACLANGPLELVCCRAST